MESNVVSFASSCKKCGRELSKEGKCRACDKDFVAEEATPDKLHPQVWMTAASTIMEEACKVMGFYILRPIPDRPNLFGCSCCGSMFSAEEATDPENHRQDCMLINVVNGMEKIINARP